MIGNIATLGSGLRILYKVLNKTVAKFEFIHTTETNSDNKILIIYPIKTEDKEIHVALISLKLHISAQSSITT